jgi:hypothetical protein
MIHAVQTMGFLDKWYQSSINYETLRQSLNKSG